MPRAKKSNPSDSPSSSSAGHFFAAQLAGEEPPSRETMQALLAEADRLWAAAPWETLFENQLMVCDDPVSGERCYLSVMGSLGEFIGFYAYVGEAGFGMFLEMQANTGDLTPGDFYAGLRALAIHWPEDGRRGLDKPDKDLLDTLAPEKKNANRGKSKSLPPEFRSLRPGYHPWYPTDSEARSLTICARAFLFGSHTLMAQDGDPWIKRGQYPLIKLNPADHSPQSIESVAPGVPQSPLKAVTADPLPPELVARLQRIKAGRPKQAGAWEIDHFYGTGRVGEKNERPSVIHGAIAADATSGIVFPPELLSPGDSVSAALAKILCTAAEATSALPKELQVKNEARKTLISEAAKIVGVPVRIMGELPAIEEIKAQLLGVLGM